jgi:hypothetical protein
MKFKISYRPSLGSFLDEQGIEWIKISDDFIFILCPDASSLFSIAIQYNEWYNTIKLS